MQFEFAGVLAVADGRYLVREGTEGERQSVLVVESLGAPAPPARRRRRPQPAEGGGDPAALPLTRVTAVRAFQPFESDGEADRWLEEALSSEEILDELVAEGIGLLNRALHAQAAASADPRLPILAPEQASGVRTGWGSGEDVADGRFAVAHDVDIRGGVSRRRQRVDELRPQERVAAVLGGREQIDACETLLLRARADLDAGRVREAALQLRVGLEALLIELLGVLAHPGHEEDLAEVEAGRQEVGEAANAALRGDLSEGQAGSVTDLLSVCERILRRRRILRG